jgi:hypothetical protein
MLSFFTDPYPDELLYSVFARYHFYSGNINLKDTLTELFGKNIATPSFEIGNYLNFLCNKLGGAYTPEGLIKNHSVFPFYAPFLPMERKNELLQDLIWSDGQGIYTKLGIVAGSICKTENIYYCLICLREDIQRFGESYIHREHQLQGVLVCSHHGCYLKKYPIKPWERSRIEYVRLEEELLNLSDICLYPENDFDRLLQVAKAAYYLLTHDFVSVGKKDILSRYKSLLYEKNLVTSNLRVRQDELHDLVVNHYGSKFLSLLESDIDRNDEYNWLKVATRDVARTVHPLRHILLILRLSGNMEDFFSEIWKVYHPFGAGPWPCLNSAAEHYRQDAIHQVIITADSKTRKPVGTFTCECGYRYSRTGPDQSEKDRYRKGRIKAFGHVWEKKLQELFTEGNLSYRKLAFHMGCDVKTVQKFETVFVKQVADKKAASVEVITNQRNQNLCESCIKRILQIKIEQPELSRTELRKLCKKEYGFLYKHDKENLFKILPKAKPVNGIKGYIDWQQRDREIFLQLEKVLKEMLNQEKLTRISRSSLGKKSRQISLMDKHLDKLPRCKDFISRFAETTQQFQIRRCKQVITNMQAEGVPLVEWKIWRKAGLRHEAYNLIKDKLDWNHICDERFEISQF